MTVDVFREIGDAVEERWRAAGYDERAFPSIAANVLREKDAPSRATPDAITNFVLDAPSLPRQARVDIEFPFTLYRADAFTLQAYFWVDGTTDIHDHTFWGAFQVFAGSSIHCRYAFHETARPSAYALRGRLEPLSLEQLATGDVREIVAGRGFIHSLFHLDRPSVSLLLSTSRVPPEYAEGRSYLHPGFAFDRQYNDERFDRRMRVLDLLYETRREDYVRELVRFVSGADVIRGFSALLRASRKLDGDQLSHVLSKVEPTHDFVPSWMAAFEELRRQGDVFLRRRFIHDPEHRYFLALVLNAPRREDIFMLVERRVPGRDPIDTVMRWIEELAKVPVEGPGGPTAIGAPLDEAGLIVLRALLRGYDEAGVIEAMKAEFDAAEVDEQAGDIRDLIAAFRESVFFRALLPRVGDLR